MHTREDQHDNGDSDGVHVGRCLKSRSVELRNGRAEINYFGQTELSLSSDVPFEGGFTTTASALSATACSPV